MLAYSYLATGFKGLAYYRYNGSSPTTIPMGLVGLFNNPGPLYDAAADLNIEIQNLGEALKFLTSEDIRFVPGSVGDMPTGLVDWSAGAGGDPHIIDVTVDLTNPANIGAGKDGLIGFFTDDDGDYYFMLVNLYQGQSLTPAEAALDFTIEFDSSIDSIWRLDRITGLAEEIPLVDHILTLSLPGGTGDLFKYGDGLFPGMLSLPGDADGDGDVDADDMAVISANYGLATGNGAADGDHNGDGIVDLSDWSIAAVNFGVIVSDQFGADSLPEPASLMLLITAAAACSRRTYRRHRQ
jgi:hypothetical protein